MEEFNEIFYAQLTDDQNFLAMSKNHFRNFLNDPNNGILTTTPLKNKQSPFLEEEKSTLDTNANNKYSNILSESELLPHDVVIQPFVDKINEAIEEEKEDKCTSNDDHNGKNDRNGDGQMEIDNDVISHLLSNGKI